MIKKQVALGYIRLSQTRDKSDLNSVERQKANIKKVCDANNWTLELYEDADKHKSGTSVKERLEWQRLEARLLDNDVVALVANDMSRIHRKMWRVGQLIEKLENNKIILVLADDKRWIDFNNSNDVAQIKLMGWFDEQYADDARKRAESSVRYRRENGITIGMPPFGTTRDENKMLIRTLEGAWLLADGAFQAGAGNTIPEENAVWRAYADATLRVLEIYVQGHIGYKKISNMMNDDLWAYRNRYGIPVRFDPEAIRRIISSWDIYAGNVPEEKARNRAMSRNEYETIVSKLKPEKAVFPFELLVNVGDVIVRRSKGKRLIDYGVRRKTYPYTLQGILYCAHCEKTAKFKSDATFRTKLGGIHANLGKGRYRHREHDNCDVEKRSIKMDIADERVFELIKLLEINKTELKRVISLAQSFFEDDNVQDSHQQFEQERSKAIAKCERAKRVARADFIDKHITEKEYVSRLESLDDEIRLWESRTSDVEKVQVELSNCLNKISEITKLWETATPEAKQQFVQSLFDEIVFDLDKERIVDFKLKGWANTYVMGVGELYAEESKTPLENSQEVYTEVAPTGLEPVSPP